MDVESVVDEGPGLAFIVYPEVDELFFLISKVLYSEKAKKFCEIFLLLFTVCTVVKSKRKISQNFVDFSEYINFTFARVCFAPGG